MEWRRHKVSHLHLFKNKPFFGTRLEIDQAKRPCFILKALLNKKWLLVVIDINGLFPDSSFFCRYMYMFTAFIVGNATNLNIKDI